MANTFFQFKQFTVHQDLSAMKVTTDACLFGALAASLLQQRRLNILDIGTGTGLLALMLAQANKEAIIDAIEIDEQAVLQARQNIAASPWRDRIKTFHLDIKNYQPAGKYDCIISNPPFYENELKGANTQKNKAHHDEGLLLAELFAVIKKMLAPGGRFYILLPYKRKTEAEILCREMELGISHRILVRQSETHGYFRLIIEGSNSSSDDAIKETALSVRDKDQHYTPAFVALLKDYYLHL